MADETFHRTRKKEEVNHEGEDEMQSTQACLLMAPPPVQEGTPRNTLAVTETVQRSPKRKKEANESDSCDPTLTRRPRLDRPYEGGEDEMQSTQACLLMAPSPAQEGTTRNTLVVAETVQRSPKRKKEANESDSCCDPTLTRRPRLDSP
jgi:hypothetical protein